MSDSISVCIGNYHFYNIGQLRDTWIDLPVEPQNIKPWLVKHGLYDTRHEEIYVSDYDGIPLGCSYGNLFNEYTPLHRLNILAQLIQDHPSEAETVERFITISGDEPESLLGLCNWILEADELPVYSYDIPEWCADDSPEEKFGLTLARYSPWYELLEKENVADYFSLSRYGEAQSMNVALGDDGYVDQTCDYPNEDFHSWKELLQLLHWNQDD